MHSQHPNESRLTVYYDGDCPLCLREIAFFRKRQISGRVNWINICSSSDDALGNNLSRCDAMSRFTVRKPEGTLLSGAAAFAEMWRVTPGFVWLGQLARFKPIEIALEVLYRGFLRVRPRIQRLVKSNTEAPSTPAE